MLREIKKIRQESHEFLKRWFQDEDIDLFIWQNDETDVARFELTYNKRRHEKSLVWSSQTGFTHYDIETGEGFSGHAKMSPICHPSEKNDISQVQQIFKNIPQKIASQVIQSIADLLMSYQPNSSPRLA
jgi:hypothetical protein